MIRIEFDLRGIEKAIAALRQLASESFVADALRRTLPTLKSLQRDRYDRISRSTPYSPGYIGRLKPSRQHRAGVAGDPGYAKDTLALYSDLSQNVQVAGRSVSIWSDLAYADYQEQLLQRKHDLSFFLADDIYGDIATTAISAEADRVWGE